MGRKKKPMLKYLDNYEIKLIPYTNYYKHLYGVDIFGTIWNVTKQTRLAKRLCNRYEQATLGNHNSNLYTHKLVAEAFIPNPEGKSQVNHIDGDKLNNKVSNLEWVTPSENCRHAFRIGLECNKGDRHPQAKLNSEQVVNIRRLRGAGYTSKEIKSILSLDCSIPTIQAAGSGRNWSHI